ncbi:hypothetical protein AMAG_02846 [Allomyces macrogynus ATCC 38327]|uniref:Uncharacterized protein n=1 Tax=Allomyces macrogynus (strain ATCC 38327) TaxID=578462 RepID=A0A0L0S3W8_ALLM3|nr:hypothetical protein AMAG_02846 [Allomyces macrogynus ATCC 38327]|eukprot:KNE57096.1 hypothetical protein AMAG_02846 [Allomyces macrogynus ATCC 38327]
MNGAASRPARTDPYARGPPAAAVGTMSASSRALRPEAAAFYPASPPPGVYPPGANARVRSTSTNSSTAARRGAVAATTPATDRASLLFGDDDPAAYQHHHRRVAAPAPTPMGGPPGIPRPPANAPHYAASCAFDELLMQRDSPKHADRPQSLFGELCGKRKFKLPIITHDPEGSASLYSCTLTLAEPTFRFTTNQVYSSKDRATRDAAYVALVAALFCDRPDLIAEHTQFVRELTIDQAAGTAKDFDTLGDYLKEENRRKLMHIAAASASAAAAKANGGANGGAPPPPTAAPPAPSIPAIPAGTVLITNTLPDLPPPAATADVNWIGLVNEALQALGRSPATSKEAAAANGFESRVTVWDREFLGHGPKKTEAKKRAFERAARHVARDPATLNALRGVAKPGAQKLIAAAVAAESGAAAAGGEVQVAPATTVAPAVPPPHTVMAEWTTSAAPPAHVDSAWGAATATAAVVAPPPPPAAIRRATPPPPPPAVVQDYRAMSVDAPPVRAAAYAWPSPPTTHLTGSAWGDAPTPAPAAAPGYASANVSMPDARPLPTAAFLHDALQRMRPLWRSTPSPMHCLQSLAPILGAKLAIIVNYDPETMRWAVGVDVDAPGLRHVSVQLVAAPRDMDVDTGIAQAAEDACEQVLAATEDGFREAAAREAVAAAEAELRNEGGSGWGGSGGRGGAAGLWRVDPHAPEVRARGGGEGAARYHGANGLGGAGLTAPRVVQEEAGGWTTTRPPVQAGNHRARSAW